MKTTTKILIEHFAKGHDVQELRKQLIELSCAFDFLDDNDKKKAIHDCIYLIDIVIDEKEGEGHEE